MPLKTHVPARLKFIKADEIEYPWKFADRQKLDALATQVSDASGIVLVQRGLITDTTTANIAIYSDKQWLTPRIPLLPGTTRARFIHEGWLQEADITPDMFMAASRLALMNALIGFRELNLSKKIITHN
ncbi:aminotransferase class IV [Desulfurispira natronophila]|uniref:Branched-subunit amino acid aminotransferase/4-amino-4-deoxychorismate lyase n=1 Tax=Desulfurispira natronophila TaxID=682562 RepID=A0A7W8DGR2_9BACT|nr:aminotransferase class IV [Desulfurispira natronophila]MBB5021690.1 branched-subunit amino acid aminotransferase/4-amino-4-deoxychorismate lyase [Desulfurispira natronophila]